MQHWGNMVPWSRRRSDTTQSGITSLSNEESAKRTLDDPHFALYDRRAFQGHDDDDFDFHRFHFNFFLTKRAGLWT